MDEPFNTPRIQNGHPADLRQPPRTPTNNRDSLTSSSSSSEDDDSIFQNRIRPVNLPPSEEEQQPTASNIFKNITIEPLMFLHMVGIAGSSIVVQNLYLERVCRVTMGYNNTVCENLTDPKNSDYETEVEKHVTIYTTYRGLIEAGFPILFSLFLGPWTDVHGTKYPILLPLLGYLLSALTYLILTYAPDLEPEYILFASIPVALTGGMVAMIMSVFSYMSKITTVENRSFRVAMLEGSWFLGGPVGLITGGYIYKCSDFNTVFITCALLYAIAFIYGVIAIQEESNLQEGEIRHCCSDMFNVAAVKDIFATIAIERPGKSRRWMHIMLITICLRIFIMMGYLNTMYLYTRHQFGWNLANYTQYSVADSFIAITGTFIMVMITMRIFKLNDSIIGIIGTVGSVLGTLIFAFASAGWMIYLGAVMSMFAGLISIVIRAMLSKIVAKEEIAKVFTFLACGEASMPLIAVPLYNLVYNSTLGTFPGSVFIISTSLYVTILAAFVYLYISMRHYAPHEDMRNENEAEA